MQDNQIANLDLVGFNFSNKPTLKIELLVGSHIDLRVFLVTSQIIVELFDHRNRQHNNEWHHKRYEETDA